MEKLKDDFECFSLGTIYLVLLACFWQSLIQWLSGEPMGPPFSDSSAEISNDPMIPAFLHSSRNWTQVLMLAMANTLPTEIYPSPLVLFNLDLSLPYLPCVLHGRIHRHHIQEHRPALQTFTVVLSLNKQRIIVTLKRLNMLGVE